MSHFDRIGKPPLERIEAVMYDLWRRAEIDDRVVEARGHDFACWANDLGIALHDLRERESVDGMETEKDWSA